MVQDRVCPPSTANQDQIWATAKKPDLGRGSSHHLGLPELQHAPPLVEQQHPSVSEKQLPPRSEKQHPPRLEKQHPPLSLQQQPGWSTTASHPRVRVRTVMGSAGLYPSADGRPNSGGATRLPSDEKELRALCCSDSRTGSCAKPLASYGGGLLSTSSTGTGPPPSL
ncbi:hypothetical protein C8034_v004383 [Colletotrichum sidae]|uniref:Uncharacterized protein n=1 Tax=Colletotrichum sidae TaxID=1347389 RepID=A0A4R8T8N2_9PEZI|nr:hypothetical protein C8034_v004383 [Colletotrichum sidae]